MRKQLCVGDLPVHQAFIAPVLWGVGKSFNSHLSSLASIARRHIQPKQKRWGARSGEERREWLQRAESI